MNLATDFPMDTPTPPTTPEAVLAARLNVPRDSFKRWRDGGNLKRMLHYIKDGHAYHLTPEGEAEVMRLIGLGETLPTGPAKILMLPACVRRAVPAWGSPRSHPHRDGRHL
jgi:hypothetical protein